MVLLILDNVQNTFFSNLTLLQLQGGSGKPFVNEENLREVNALNTLMHSACSKRILCKYPSCDLNPESTSTTAFKKAREKKKKHIYAYNCGWKWYREDKGEGWAIGMHQRTNHVYHIPWRGWTTCVLWYLCVNVTSWVLSATMAGNNSLRQLFQPASRMNEKFPATTDRQGLLPSSDTVIDAVYVYSSSLTYVSPWQLLLLTVRCIQV